MSDLEVFGSLIDGDDVDKAVEATLREWMPTYLRRMERKKGLKAGLLKNPQSYVITSVFEHYPEEALPAILIISPGLLDRPKMDGSRNYRATFAVRLGVFVEAKDRASTERLVKLYAAALRELLVHKGDLGGFATASSWEHEDWDVHEKPTNKRTIGTSEIRFSVEVRNIVKRFAGPAEPTEAEPGTIPTVTRDKAPEVAASASVEAPVPPPTEEGTFPGEIFPG